MNYKTNIFLIIQSLIIGYFILIMIHPSLPISRIIGFILSSAAFFASWKLFPLLTKGDFDVSKFSLLFLLFLFFPHYLLRELHFVILGFVAYYLMVFLFVKYTKFSTSIIMMFLILSISFSVLHILMNPEYKNARLEKNLARNADGPIKYRILLPELMNLARAFGLRDIFGLMIVFRFFSFALVLLSTHLLITLFSNNYYLSMFLPLAYVILIPFSWDILYVTDFPEIFFSTIFVYSMLKKSYFWASFFFVLGLLNRDTIVFNLAFFFFYAILNANKPLSNLIKTIKANKKLFLLLAFLFAASITIKFAIVSIYGKTWMYENQLYANINSMKEYASRFERFNFQDYIPWNNRFYRLLMFGGGLYILIAFFFRKVPFQFLASFLLTLLLFTPLLLYIGNINETRILYVFYPYFMVCLAFILESSVKSRDNLKSKI